MYTRFVNPGVCKQINSKNNLPICILYYRMPTWVHGAQFDYKCIYPYYGEDCFMKCDKSCSADLCDFVSGCEVTNIG